MEQTHERTKAAMDLRGVTQAELVRRTGIGKSSICTYLKGGYLPKQRDIYKIASALDVSEAWLMGDDVPMERISSNGITLSEQEIIAAYRRASPEIKFAIEQILKG